MKTEIEWRTGLPTEGGFYIVTYIYTTSKPKYSKKGKFVKYERITEKLVMVADFVKRNDEDQYWILLDADSISGEVVAWCPLSNIEPYKKEK